MEISHLPEDIIVDILSRLPAKSLWKLRRVSKSWLLLISSYDFAKAHVRKSVKNDDKIIFRCTGSSTDLYTFSVQSSLDGSFSNGLVHPPVDQNSLAQHVSLDCGTVWFEGSCNGLICLSSYDETLSLWNPTTRQVRKLPNSGSVVDSGHYMISYGFGYDELHDDYKVVECLHIEHGDGTVNFQLKIYSLRANSWKTSPNWPGGDGAVDKAGKFLNGAIYWAVHRSDGWAIVSYHLSTDTFSVLQNLPDDVEKDDVQAVEAQILMGCVALCCESNSQMDIWLMKGSWTKVATIPVCFNIWDYLFVTPHPWFVWVHGGMLINYARSLSSYDPKMDAYNDSFDIIPYADAIAYRETLVSPNLEDGFMAQTVVDMPVELV